MSLNPSAPAGPSGSNSRKVAIPRLQRPSQSKPSEDRRRVPRACTACRSHKIKCTGDVPRCKHCEATDRDCVYILPRKDRLKTVTERCLQMAALLKTLRALASEEDSTRIGELLEATEEDMVETRQTPAASIPNPNDEDLRPSGPGLDSTTSGRRLQRLDTDCLDLLDENLHENDQSRATGFVGQNSEVQWLRSFLLLERADVNSTPNLTSPPILPNSEQVSTVTYYLDEQSIELDFPIDPYGLPAPDAVEHLLNVYMEKVHSSFPILPRKLFEDQCRKYFDALFYGTAPRLNNKWQAILNLVFAIGAHYSRLSKTTWQTDTRTHELYRARAVALAWTDPSVQQHPDLPQIQVGGLLAFYYLSVGQASRAWVVIGVALRFAMALGLHVRNEDKSASGSKREVLIRVWWSLYQLERQISIMTGRPSIIVDLYCSVPLPAPFFEQQTLDEGHVLNAFRRSSTASVVSPGTTLHQFSGSRSMSSSISGARESDSGGHFKAAVQLCVITQSILVTLYTAGTKIRSPDDLQQDIVQLDQRLDDWLARLPAEFNFQIYPPGSTTSQTQTQRERTLLTFQFYSAKILLTRPCLRGLEGNGGGAQDAMAQVDFTRRMADICVDTAKAVVDMLPNQPQPRFIYEYGPWWTIVHNLMQALAVLLLALSYSAGVQQDDLVLAGYCKKIILWLRSMESSLAIRACVIAVNCYELVANRLSLPWPLFSEGQVPVARPGSGFMSIDDSVLFPVASEAPYGYTGKPKAHPGFYESEGTGLYIQPPDERTFEDPFYSQDDRT